MKTVIKISVKDYAKSLCNEQSFIDYVDTVKPDYSSLKEALEEKLPELSMGYCSNCDEWYCNFNEHEGCPGLDCND